MIDSAADRDWFFQRVRRGQRFRVKVSVFPGYPQDGHKVHVAVYKGRRWLDSATIAFGSPYKLTGRLGGKRTV